MNSNHQVHSQFSLEIVVPGSTIYLGRFHQLLAQYKTVLLKKLDLGHGRTICWQLLWNMIKFHWCELYFEQENVEIIFSQHCTNWSIISFSFYLISLNFFVFYSTWSQPKLQCKMQIIQMTQSQRTAPFQTMAAAPPIFRTTLLTCSFYTVCLMYFYRVCVCMPGQK